jgi:hypothetical protein
MKALVFALVSVLIGTPALAQQASDLNGQWHSRVVANGNTIDTVVVINGQQYSMTVTDITVQGYQYANYQSGQFYFTPPGHLGFQVLDWSPKDYEGQPMSMPGNSNVTIQRMDGRTLVVTDDTCMQNSPGPQCAATFEREL